VPPQIALKHARQVDGVQFTPVTNQLTELTVTASTTNQAEGDADLAAKAYLRHLAFRVSRLHRSAGYRAKLVNRSAILDPPTAGQPHRSLLLGGVLGLAAGLVLGFLVLTISGISGRRLKPAAA
jgi:hypothetical protein